MNSKLNPEPGSPFLISLADASRKRLAGVECHTLANEGMAHPVCVALPVSYGARSRQSYPLVLLLDGCSMLGSAIEMSRLMAETKEIRECMLVNVDLPRGEADITFLREQLLPWCRRNYRVATDAVSLFSPRPGTAAAVAAQIEGLEAIDSRTDAEAVPALVSGLRRRYATGGIYGEQITALQKPWIAGTLGLVAPLIGALRPTAKSKGSGNPHVLHSQLMGRDFEVFAVMPASWKGNGARRYPALIVLDANIEFATAAETAARLAARGETDEIAVIGIGVPRAAGHVEFGFRRFEEFSPPADGYRYDDALGRIFRSLFSMRGQSARERIGQAPGFYNFITKELLPLLQRQLPIDENNLGILGHSAGGTFVGYTLSHEHSPFRHYASISPGVGMSGSWLMRAPQSQRPPARKASEVFLCIGSEEKTNLFNQIAGIPETEAFASQLRKVGAPSVRYQCFEQETHSSVYPRAVAQALASFYPRAA